VEDHFRSGIGELWGEVKEGKGGARAVNMANPGWESRFVEAAVIDSDLRAQSVEGAHYIGSDEVGATQY
jgi:hypothetical protein